MNGRWLGRFDVGTVAGHERASSRTAIFFAKTQTLKSAVDAGWKSVLKGGALTIRHRRTRWSPTCSCGGKARGPWTASCRRKRSSRTPDRSRWCEARFIAAVDIGAARLKKKRASGTLLTERRAKSIGARSGPGQTHRGPPVKCFSETWDCLLTRRR